MRSHLLFALSSSVALLCGCPSSLVVGNGQAATDTRAVTGFTQVANGTLFDVTVTSGSSFSVVLRADSNILPLVSTRVVNDSLVIDSNVILTLMPKIPATAQITMPSFAGASNAASGHMDISGFTTKQDLNLNNSGSGPLTFSGPGAAVSITVGGSGNTTLTGSGDSLVAIVSGSGTLSASGFTVGRASITASGAGSATATVNGNADFTNDGMGTITATVNSGTVNCTLSGSGDISWTGTGTEGATTDTGSGTVHHL